MEIYGCLFECKIEEIFKHYTDEIEAVQHAKDIEEAYVKNNKSAAACYYNRKVKN